MSGMTVLGYQAQPRRPHLGTITRAAQGLKGPSRPSGPNACSRLQPHLGEMASSQLEYVGYLGTQCPQEQPELQRPPRIISSDPLIAQTETFLKPEEQLAQGHPASQRQGDVCLPCPARRTLQPYFSSHNEPCRFTAPRLCSP